MVKECPILINNTAVTVVKYGDVEVQFPAINKNAKTIFVDYVEGKYTIVDSLKNEQEIIEKTVEETFDIKEVKKTTKDGVKSQQKKYKDT